MLEQGNATRRDFEKCKGTGEIGIGEGKVCKGICLTSFSGNVI